ncbi:AAA family ATPase, partial [bacterium]|nr:AAA family ATPase [bacterium]
FKNVIIKNLKINRYKSIKTSLILNFSGINIFIGQNNCGKSNILDALEYSFNKNLENSNFYYPEADIEINFKDEKGKEFLLKNRKGDRGLLPKNNLSVFKKQIKKLDEKAFSDYRQIEKDYKTFSSHQSDFEKFKKHLRKHFPKISITENALDIKYEREGLYEGQRRVTIDYLGSGFGRIFTILLYIFHPDYSVVLISEPETHLHPALIKKLLWAMENCNAGQIMFTTHSPLFVKPVTLAQLFRVIKDKSGTKVFTMQDGRYDYDRLVRELNADNLEMFFADKVILVEGVSDQVLIQGLINKFYKKNKEIKVIQTYGKGNTRVYADLLKIFQIPFLVVLDNDALQTYHLGNLLDRLEIKIPHLSRNKFLLELKKNNIHVFPNGDLEKNYPRKYQRDDSKSANALLASKMIDQKDFNSKIMKNLREIISSI